MMFAVPLLRYRSPLPDGSFLLGSKALAVGFGVFASGSIL